MAEFPYIPLFTDAYLGDTTHLTTFEHGAYLLLLIVSWRTAGCRVPDDDLLLARYTRTTPDKWRKLRPVLGPFFTIRDGFWHQARLQDEFQHLQSRKDQQSKAGTASARAKALKRHNRDATDEAPPLERGADETSTPTPTPTPTVSSVAKATSPRGRKSPTLAVKPDDVEQSVWDDFQALRHQKRAPLTDTALKGILLEAAKAGWTLNDALTECCQRGWQGFNADWIKGNRNGSGQSRTGWGRTADAADDWVNGR